MAVDRVVRLRMFARVLFKSLTVRKSRVAVAFFSITIGAAVVAALLSLYMDISIKMSQELRTYGANFFIGPKSSAGGQTLALDTYHEVMGEIPVDRLMGGTPYLYGVVRLDLGEVVMAGVDFRGLKRLSPYWQVEGSWISVDFDERNAMIGRALAVNMELGVGDEINVINRGTGFQKVLVVKGIMETGQAEDEQIFVNLPLAQKILGEKGRIHHAMFSISAQGMQIDTLAARLQRRFPQIEAKPIRKISHAEGKILEKIKGLMALVAFIILTLTTLCVMTTLMAMVAERSTEIGLMKALGADNGRVALQFLSETELIGLAGGVAGVVMGFLLAQLLGQAVFSSFISFRPAVLPFTLIVTNGTALLASIIPVRTAVCIVPARVLKGGE